MKIGIVCYPSIGGSGIVATELGHQLAMRGHEVHFITYEPPIRLQLDTPGIFFHPVDVCQYDLFKYPDYALTLAAKIAAVCRDHKLDIVHTHYAIPHATSGYLAKQILGPNAPTLITTLHGTDITLIGRDPSFLPIVKFSIEASDLVTTVSESLKKETQTTFSIDRPIEVIPNFVETQPLSHPNNDEKIIVHASNFRPLKRIPDVIHTFAKIVQTVPARLQLIGSGTDLGIARDLVHSLDLKDKVDFLGSRSQLDLTLADLFLLPSAQESFGLAALEAMAHGCPVIATNVGGLPEVIDHGKSGYLLPLGATDQMAAKAIDILHNPTPYRIAAHARATHFNTERIIPQYEELYEMSLRK